MHRTRLTRPRGVVLVAVMVTAIVVGIMTAGLLRAASLERFGAIGNELDASVKYVAIGGLTLAQSSLVYTSQAQWQGLLTTNGGVIQDHNPFPVNPRFRLVVTVTDNDDGDGNLLVDRDGELIVTAAAYSRVSTESAAYQVHMRRVGFDDFMFLNGTGDVRVGANFYTDGRVHTNDMFKIYGNNTEFDDFVSSVDGYRQYGYEDPKFNGGYDFSADNIDFPTITGDEWTELANTAKEGGRNLYLYPTSRERHIEFTTDGKIKVYRWSGSNYSLETPLKAIGPSGVYTVTNPLQQKDYDLIYNSKRVTVLGQVGTASDHTRITIASDQNMYINGDITYYDPENDVLGLMSKRAVYLETRSYAPRGMRLGYNATVSAAIYAGYKFHVTSTQPNKGTLTFLGSISMAHAYGIGTGNVWRTKRNYLFDKDLRTKDPPFFFDVPNLPSNPLTGSWKRLLDVPAAP